MGKSDIIARQYLRDNAVFADVFNYLLYDGREVLQPSKLHTLDSAIPVTLSREKEKASIHKLRDVYKIYSAKTDGNLAYLLLGIEHQTELHYAMPARAMLYDALSYEQQLSDIARRHSKSRDYRGHTPAEYLSGFYKEDQLIPVITVVLMLSPAPWNGPTELHQIIHVPDPTLLPMIENYKLHLIAPAHLTKDNVNKFKSSLREVLGFIKYSENPDQLESLVKNNPRFEQIDRDAAMVIKTCTNSAFDINSDRKEKSYNMCKALDELCRRNRESGQEKERVTNILSLMDSLHLPPAKAMELLKIPTDEQEKYLQLVAQQNGSASSESCGRLPE